MRVDMEKDGQTQSVKDDRIQRFLDQGWRVKAEPEPKNNSRSRVMPKAKITADAVVVKADSLVEDKDYDPDLEAPLFNLPESTPTNEIKGD